MYILYQFLYEIRNYALRSYKFPHQELAPVFYLSTFLKDAHLANDKGCFFSVEKFNSNKKKFFFFYPHTLTIRLKRSFYRGFSGEGRYEGKNGKSCRNLDSIIIRPSHHFSILRPNLCVYSLYKRSCENCIKSRQSFLPESTELKLRHTLFDFIKFRQQLVSHNH